MCLPWDYQLFDHYSVTKNISVWESVIFLIGILFTERGVALYEGSKELMPFQLINRVLNI